MSAEEFIKKIMDLLKDSDRIGNAVDDPEGSRFILISDTLADELYKEAEEVWLMMGR